MCGIFGILNTSSAAQLDEARFSSALETLSHRGPNGRIFRKIDENTLFGHARLSIIDLSNQSNQPMVFNDRYWLTYNGEIFNYVELRAELEELGAVFKTSGDVEVLLQAYAVWGASCVERFNGMWAFAIYDSTDKSLFCSRDRFGEKPFNYAFHEGRFFFASEIKAIIAYEPRLVEPDYNVISNYCRTSVGAQHEQSWFRDIKRLPPGCNLVLKDGKASIDRYWTYPENTRHDVSFEDAKAQFQTLFEDAVRVRMRSDVPLGVTLSAGLDSNYIAHVMQSMDNSPHYCFTARFDDDDAAVQDTAIYVDGGVVDESVTARKVAAELHLNSVVVDTNFSDFVAALQKIVYHLESGNSSPAVLPLMQLLDRANDDVTVLLEGQGADELLGGYIVSMFWPSFWDLVKSGRIGEAIASYRMFSRTYTIGYSVKMFVRGLTNRFPSISRLHQKIYGIESAFGPALARYTRMSDYPDVANSTAGDHTSRELRRQHAGTLVNLLHYGDAISMANSLESRMPFLDYRLVDFAWTLPSRFKVKLATGKWLQREAMRSYVPDWIVDNKLKYGFTTPIGNQFKKPFPPNLAPTDILLSDRCLRRGLFDKQGLTAMIDAHRSGKRDHGPLLFRMLSTELWFRTFVDEAPKT
jgi:asparagine synthase (glutamine-hydrolysing)